MKKLLALIALIAVTTGGIYARESKSCCGEKKEYKHQHQYKNENCEEKEHKHQHQHKNNYGAEKKEDCNKGCCSTPKKSFKGPKKRKNR